MPPSLQSQLASLRTQAATQQPLWGDRTSRIPVERYVSPAVHAAEVEALFRPLPLVAAHASELGPGQVLAHAACGVPLLLARDPDGTVRAFLNVCRHRGMRLVDAGPARPKASVVCPYHGWTYLLDGRLRHMLHAEGFDACPPGERDLVALPCVERHGLVWVVPQPGAAPDLPAWLGGLDDELAFFGIDRLQHFRTFEYEVAANWKLIVDAFLEPYHIRVLHKDTISPFFADGITAAQRHGPHISSLVARREALAWATGPDASVLPTSDELREIATPSQVIFPNTITIFHPDYLSLITLYPTGPETHRWTHRMLVPRERTTPDWLPHWDKTSRLIEEGVFQKEDIRCAVGIQQGLRSGANRHLTAGRMEQALDWFHTTVVQHTGGT